MKFFLENMSIFSKRITSQFRALELSDKKIENNRIVIMPTLEELMS